MNTANIRIMVVDDDELMRKMMKKLIKRISNTEIVGEAETGEKAVLMARQLIPDIVLTDFKMPGMNGVEASKQIMYENPDIKILLTSSYITAPITQWAFETGILGVMSKFSLFGELEEAIYSLYTGCKFCCSRVTQIELESAVLI